MHGYAQTQLKDVGIDIRTRCGAVELELGATRGDVVRVRGQRNIATDPDVVAHTELSRHAGCLALNRRVIFRHREDTNAALDVQAAGYLGVEVADRREYAGLRCY